MATQHPRAAPGDLELIRRLVNTFDVEDGSDDVADPRALRDWLLERGLLADGEAVTDDDLRRFVAIREALRKLLLANNGAPVDRHAIEALNSAAARAELRVRFEEHGAGALAPASAGFDGTVARLLAIVLHAMSDGTWPRLKACAEHTCEVAFYDWSRNRSGTWCKMSVCGNRTKARNYRRRRSAAG